MSSIRDLRLDSPPLPGGIIADRLTTPFAIVRDKRAQGIRSDRSLLRCIGRRATPSVPAVYDCLRQFHLRRRPTMRQEAVLFLVLLLRTRPPRLERSVLNLGGWNALRLLVLVRLVEVGVVVVVVGKSAPLPRRLCRLRARAAPAPSSPVDRTMPSSTAGFLLC